MQKVFPLASTWLGQSQPDMGRALYDEYFIDCGVCVFGGWLKQPHLALAD